MFALWLTWVLTEQKGFLVNHKTPFLTKGLEKSLCDFTGTIYVLCENPVRVHCQDILALRDNTRHPDKGRVRFVNQKETEPENSLHLLVGNMPEPIKRQDFLVLVPSGSQIEHGRRDDTIVAFDGRAMALMQTASHVLHAARDARRVASVVQVKHGRECCRLQFASSCMLGL